MIGRNAPCQCRSGRKFKNCCLKLPLDQPQVRSCELKPGRYTQLSFKNGFWVTGHFTVRMR